MLDSDRWCGHRACGLSDFNLAIFRVYLVEFSTRIGVGGINAYSEPSRFRSALL